MSNGDFQHEPDDELLSAYLDGELAPEERAAVEARLASDPEAEHLLHQLRSVSQSVQRLPIEPVGRDLRDEILRRVEATKPTVAAATPKQVSSSRSRRPWVWASLAVAAGLFIMVLERGTQQNKSLPVAAENEGIAFHDRRLKELPQEMAGESAEGRGTVAFSTGGTLDSLPATTTPAAPSAAPAPTDAGAPVDAYAKLLTPPAPSDGEALSKLALRGDATAKPSDAIAHGTNNFTRSDDAASFGEQLQASSALAAAEPSPSPAKAAEKESHAAVVTPPLSSQSQSDALIAQAGPPFGATALRKSLDTKIAAAQPLGAAVGGERGAAAHSDTLYDAPVQDLAKSEKPPAHFVVHISVKPESIEAKSFDKLLASHGVTMEAGKNAGGEKQDGRDAYRLYYDPDGKRVVDEADKSTNAPASGDVAAEMVFVDAPMATIAACLTDLKNDTTTYVGLQVSDANNDAKKDANNDSGKKDRAELAERGALGNTLEYDWTGFNRGPAPVEQKISNSDYDFFGNIAEGEQRKLGRENINRYGIVSKSEPLADDAKRSGGALRGEESSGPTRRLRQAESDTRDYHYQAPADEKARAGKTLTDAEQSSDKSELKPAAGTASNNVRVLFVLTPARAAAPSAPPENSPK